MIRIFFILLLTIPIGVFAQNVVVGTTVKSNGQAVNGFLKIESSNQLYFSVKQGGDFEKLVPGDITQIFVGSSLFRTIQIPSEGERFVSVLLDGLLAVYELNGRVFVKKDTSRVYELKLVDRYSRENTRFRGLLNALVVDCDSLSASNIGSTEKDVVDFARKYNSCRGSQILSYSKWAVSHSKLAWGAFVGFSIADINTKNYFLISDFVFNTAQSITVGGRMALNFSGSGKTRLLVDLSYLTANYSGISETSITTIDIKSSIFRAGIGIQKIFVTKYFNPYATAGLVAHFPTEFQVVVSNPTLIYQETKNPNLGIGGGLGIEKLVKKRISFFMEARFDASSGYGARGGPNRLGAFPYYYSFVGGVLIR